MESLHKLKQLSEDYFQLGEGPHWDDSQQCLYFVDIIANKLCYYDPMARSITKAIVDGAKSIGFIIPVKDTTDKFVIAFDSNITLIQWDGKAESVKICKHLVTSIEPEKGRINDGKADFQGRLVTGTMLVNWQSSLSNHCGVLVSYASWDQPKLKTILKNVGLSNGLAWNEKTGKMYYADSLKYCVTEYDYNNKTGNIGEGKVVFDCKSASYGLPDGCLPDGLTMDTDGHLWVALFLGSRVIQVNVENGMILKTIMMPTPMVTSVCFGGKDLDVLYVTTCSVGANNKVLDSPAGATFEVTGLGVKGHPANSVILNDSM